MKHVTYFAAIAVALVAGWYFISHQTATAPITTELSQTNEDITYETYTFVCSSGESFAITYNDQNENATLLLEGDMAYQLSRAVSGSGARYTDDGEHIEFWEHQGEATITIDGETKYESCVIENDAADTSSESMTTDQIKVTSPVDNETVSSPIVLSGEARGMWYFEASAPVVVVDWDGKIIGEGYITAEGDWMTEDFVPFSGAVEYSLPEDVPYKRGAVIFRKDNPSGLPENDAALEIPVLFE